MKRFLLFLVILLSPFSLLAQERVKYRIPKNAIFYNRNWKGVGSAKQAAYYRVLTVDRQRQKVFYDYYITGQLYAEKHYISINKVDDKQTILTGIALTFYKSGRIESIMTYSNGKANGRAVSFFANGNVGMKLNYTNGVLNGTTYTYSERGKLEYTAVWKNGTRVSEHAGGTDKYINKATGKDDFVERYRSPNPKSSQTAEPEHAATTDFARNVRYPPAEDVSATSAEKSNVTRNDKQFRFGPLYELLAGGDLRTNEMHFFDGIGASYGLTLAQVIKGYGAQEELTYSHNMQYDESANKDIVTGKQPRQMGFWGVRMGNRFTAQRVNLYTWSEEEMLNFAGEVLSYGYRPLGEGDYRSMNGNFVLEHPMHNKAGDSFAVVVSFAHLNGAYANLYHITLDTK
ncbi:MAG: toxin-antitoxin system YwqK family antitoxin [Prevotella nigrescens]|uniref:toxin-antitoxin system YwqK family antitoxin n=1 Tax=Prevotella nigrescens TaxID=28133 RepID=UPI00242A4FE8|nr:hypothetical protein [Prevotella nigrescens]